MSLDLLIGIDSSSLEQFGADGAAEPSFRGEVKREWIMDGIEKRTLSIAISPILHEKLHEYCLIHNLREEEVIERAVSEWLEREESLEHCFQEWEAEQERSNRLQ